MSAGPDEIAWHEAGHAVVARLLGARVDWVTLESDDESFGGRASVRWPSGPPAEIAALSAQVALAGPLAELARFGDDVAHDLGSVRAWDADWAEVTRCAALVEARAPERERLIALWFRRTEALVTDPDVEERIARVADALDAHGTLDETLFDDCM